MNATKVNLRPLSKCGRHVRAAADPATVWVAYVDRKPVYEIARRDGQFWIRGFGAPRMIPFRSLCRENLAHNVQLCHEIETEDARREG